MPATVPAGCEPHAPAPRRFTTSRGVSPTGMEGFVLAILNAFGLALNTSAAPKTWLSAAKGVTGTTGADWLSASDPSATLKGGAGDDTYAIWDSRITITEAAGDGIDTVQSWASRTLLSAYVENLQLMQ